MGGNWQNSSEFPRDFLSIGRFSSDFSAALWRQELGQSGGFPKDASFLLTVEVFLLTVRLFYLRWGEP